MIGLRALLNSKRRRRLAVLARQHLAYYVDARSICMHHLDAAIQMLMTTIS